MHRPQAGWNANPNALTLSWKQTKYLYAPLGVQLKQEKLQRMQIRAGSHHNISTCGIYGSICIVHSPFSFTFNRDLKVGAVTLVFWSHLAPVGSSISRDHFDDLHFISVDLGDESITLLLLCHLQLLLVISEQGGSDLTVQTFDGSVGHTLVFLSNTSLNCMCFPALLPRSSHFPFSHFMVGFLASLVVSTLAMKVISDPVVHKQVIMLVALTTGPKHTVYSV